MPTNLNVSKNEKLTYLTISIGLTDAGYGWAWCERLVRSKHTSLIVLNISDKEKKVL
jgi:hypothetical protein